MSRAAFSPNGLVGLLSDITREEERLARRRRRRIERTNNLHSFVDIFGGSLSYGSDGLAS